MRLLLFVLVVLGVVCVETWGLGLNSCPTSSRIASCSPKCKDDSNCHGAQKCCTNICSTKSCTDINQYLSDSNKRGGSSSSSKGGTGTYCGNVKCGAYEKCELDRSTKREKCVRT